MGETKTVTMSFAGGWKNPAKCVGEGEIFMQIAMNVAAYHLYGTIANYF